MIKRKNTKKIFAAANKAALIALSAGLLVGTIGTASACTTKTRGYDANDPVRVVSELINNSSIPVLVQLGRKDSKSGVKKTEAKVIHNGKNYTHTHKMGTAKNVDFIFYVNHSYETDVPLMKCSYNVEIIDKRDNTQWSGWTCPYQAPVELSWQCSRTWKAGKNRWVTTLELNDG